MWQDVDAPDCGDMMRNACGTVAIVTILFFSGVTRAVQQPGVSPDVPRIRVGVDAVRIDAVVTDRENRIVENLTSSRSSRTASRSG